MGIRGPARDLKDGDLLANGWEVLDATPIRVGKRWGLTVRCSWCRRERTEARHNALRLRRDRCEIQGVVQEALEAFRRDFRYAEEMARDAALLQDPERRGTMWHPRRRHSSET